MDECDGDLLGRGADAEQDGGAVGNSVGGGKPDANLAFEVAHTPDFVRLIRTRCQQPCAAVVTAKHVGIAKRVHVAADGLRGDAEVLGECIDTHFAMLAKERNDAGLAVGKVHRAGVADAFVLEWAPA